MGSFAPQPTPSPFHPVAFDSDAEDDDDDDGDDDDALDDDDASDDDGDASSTDEMLALPMRCLFDTLPFITRDKKGKQFWI